MTVTQDTAPDLDVLFPIVNVVWQEGGKYPNLIIELLYPSTATDDRTVKKQIYQDIFRTPEYFWFDPKTSEFAGFILLGGTYQPIEPKVYCGVSS